MQSTSDTNPLLHVEFRIAFDRIRAGHVQPAAIELLREARARLAGLSAPNGEPSFDNTLQALDTFTERLDWAMGVVRHLESVATYPELRAAFKAAQPEVSAFYTGIPLDAGLWRNIKAYAATPEAAGLTGARRRFFQHIEALTSYLHFESWEALMDFMMKGLEIGPYAIQKS